MRRFGLICVLALAGCGGSDSVDLPAKLGSYRDVTTVTKEKGAGNTSAQVKHERKVRSLTIKAYTDAFDGAPAGYRAYADPALEHVVYVIAVRASAPGLTIGPPEDLEYLRLATPTREVKTVGEVSCEIVWTRVTPAGKKPDPENQTVGRCQRSGDDLTVFVGGGSLTGAAGVKSAVELTNAAFKALS